MASQIDSGTGGDWLERAARAVGGRSQLADALRCGVTALGNWKRRGVPAERCPTIERITERQVTCEEMRPDVEWHVLRTADALPLRQHAVCLADGGSVVVLASPPAANDSAPDESAPERA